MKKSDCIPGVRCFVTSIDANPTPGTITTLPYKESQSKFHACYKVSIKLDNGKIREIGITRLKINPL